MATNDVHVLGNGPSISCFDRTSYDDSEHNLFIGCNFSDPVTLKPHYTIIVDIRPIIKLTPGDAKLGIPAVLSKRAFNQIQKTYGGWGRYPKDKIVVHDTIDVIQDKSVHKTLPMNSAQHGVCYALQKESIRGDIHLWGCDSFWTDNISSTTDKWVRPTETRGRVKPDLTAVWNAYWRKIFTERGNAMQFVIHCPSEQERDVVTRVSNFPSNVRIEMGRIPR